MATSPLPDLDSDSMPGALVDEEERWLDALEKGELDDNGELKKEVDESLLTARQVRRLPLARRSRGPSLTRTSVSRKLCSTSSRASRCWSCPWATRRRR